MQVDDFDELDYSVTDGVARIRLNRPDQLNAFTSRLYREFKWAVRQAGADPAVDVVVVTGTGRAFATGGDLKETLDRLESGDPLAMHAFFDNLPWSEIRSCPKVVVAAINGLCLAGGLITAVCCDISVAVESARFACTEGKVGIADALGPALLHARVGTAKLKYLLLTGRMVDAREAERIGLITEVVPDDRLESRVAEIVAELRETSPVARRLFKEYANSHTPLPDGAGLLPALASPEVVEGLRAFAEGRKPDYRPEPPAP
ncbi:MAG TPA: enoyl-CoA hydratase/isomerase family protein [Acidimicrobiia bacterium]